MLYFIRDDNNNLLGFKYNDILYYYQKNTQEDITGIYDENYQLIATYEYDSWGKILNIKDNLGNDLSNNPSHIAQINPFRYRSYYYDRETNLYYLNSRYYNPEWGRFINVDSIIGATQDHLGYNLYAYCSNNPVMYIDPEGELPILAGIAAVAEFLAPYAALAVVAGVATIQLGKALTPVINQSLNNALSNVKTIQESINRSREDKKQERNQNVYSLYDTTLKKTVYVGRTNDLDRRRAEHSRNPERARLIMNVAATNLTLDEARATEQKLIIKYGTLNSGIPGCNKRNGISPKNKKYDYYMALADRLFNETYVGDGIIWTPKN